MKKYITILSSSLILITAIGCAYNKSTTPVSHDEPRKGPLHREENVKPLGGGWYEAVGKASYANITPDDARRNAIINACMSAIQYCGFEVSQRNFDIQVESNSELVQNDFLSLTSLTTNGLILDKVIIDEKVVSDGENVDKIVRLKVKIGTQKGRKDPYFSIRASLNREMFKLDETLQVTVTSTQDCYLTILNISDEVVYILFPNTYCSDNLITKGHKFEFPSDAQLKMGITVPAILPSGKNMDWGIIKILATKKEDSFEGFCNKSQYGTYELALHDLLAYLVNLPRNEIEEVDLPYKITR
jgi:hypothetical protein